MLHSKIFFIHAGLIQILSGETTRRAQFSCQHCDFLLQKGCKVQKVENRWYLSIDQFIRQQRAISHLQVATYNIQHCRHSANTME